MYVGEIEKNVPVIRDHKHPEEFAVLDKMEVGDSVKVSLSETEKADTMFERVRYIVRQKEIRFGKKFKVRVESPENYRIWRTK